MDGSVFWNRNVGNPEIVFFKKTKVTQKQKLKKKPRSAILEYPSQRDIRSLARRGFFFSLSPPLPYPPDPPPDAWGLGLCQSTYCWIDAVAVSCAQMLDQSVMPRTRSGVYCITCSRIAACIPAHATSFMGEVATWSEIAILVYC